jgi:hypothetical protein
MPPKYEYRIRNINYVDVEDRVNGYTKNGWRLIAVVNLPHAYASIDPKSVCVVLEREVTDAEA